MHGSVASSIHGAAATHELQPRGRLRVQARAGRPRNRARDALAARARPQRPGRRRHGRRRRGGQALRRAGPGRDARLLHADRRRPLRLGPDRGHQRALRRVRDGGPALPHAEHRGVARRRLAARDAGAGPAGRDRRGEQGGGGRPGRPHDHRSRTQVRDGRARAGRTRTHRAQLDRPGRRPRRTNAASPPRSSWPPPWTS
jgi:hypothetical protein